MSRDGLRPQEGMRADRRAGQGELVNARQKELSDRALRILEELSSLGRQVQISLSKAPGNNCIAAGQLKFGGCLMLNCTRCKHAAVSVLQWKSCRSGCAGLAVLLLRLLYIARIVSCHLGWVLQVHVLELALPVAMQTEHACVSSVAIMFLSCVKRLMDTYRWQGSSQQPRDHSTGPHRPRRQHSELPFHASGRANPNTAGHHVDRAADRTDSRPRLGLQPADGRAGAGRSRPRTDDRQHTPGANEWERQHSTVRFEGLPQGSSNEAKLEHRPSSRQHSRQKSRPV